MVNEVAKLITENSKSVFFRDDYLDAMRSKKFHRAINNPG